MTIMGENWARSLVEVAEVGQNVARAAASGWFREPPGKDTLLRAGFKPSIYRLGPVSYKFDSEHNQLTLPHET
jgi:hypothetical protein